MRFEDEDLEHMAKVNTLMQKIHTDVDNIYESLMDEEKEELVSHLQSLMYTLKKLLKKHRT
jgi:hypothetical protein